MNRKLGRVAAIALSAAMISSAFAMSTATAFAAPKAPVAATANLTDATKTLYLNSTDTTDKVKMNSATGDTKSDATAPDGVKLGSLTVKSDSSTVTGATLDMSNATIAKSSGSSVDYDHNASGFNYEFSANGTTGATTFTVSGATASKGDDNYTLDPFSFTVDSEYTKMTDNTTADTTDADNFSKGILLDSTTGAVATTATAGVTTLQVAEVKLTANQSSTAFAAIPLTDQTKLAPVTSGIKSVAVGTGTVVTGGASATADEAGSFALSYTNTAYTTSTTYRNTNTITVTKNMTLPAATDVKKAADGNGYDVTYTPTGATSTTKNFSSLSGYTIKADSAGLTIDAGAVVDKVDASALSSDKTVTVDGATVNSIDTTGATTPSVVVKATAAGMPASVSTITSTGDVAIGATTDKSNVSVGTVSSTGTVTADAGTTYDATTTAIKSIKAVNVTVNSKKAKIDAIAANGTAGTVTTAVDGVSLPALTGYALTANGDTTVASIDAASKDVKIADSKTLTVTGTAKVQHIYANTTATSALAATTGTVKIGAGNLTIAPDQSATNADGNVNVFKLQLSNATAYGTAFNLSENESTINAQSADKTFANGTGALKNIYILGTTGFVDADNSTVTLNGTISATGLSDASPAASDVANGALSVESGKSAVLAVVPTPLKSLPEGYSVSWTADKGYVTLGSTSGLSTTVTGTYDAFNTYKDSDTVTATMKDSTGAPKGTVQYTVTLTAATTNTTTDFTVTTPVTALRTGAANDGVFEIAPNGNTALNKDDITVTADNSQIVAVGTISQDGSNVKVQATGNQVGNTNLTFKWTNPTTGAVTTHVVTVYVADHPVYAYVNGKIANPTDTLSFTQSTTVPITFVSANGAKIDTFNYNAGNGSIMSTRAYADTTWNGLSGAYGMYMNGPVGSATGVYVNGQKICSVKVADRPFTCDTTCNFSLKAGKTYGFKLTPAAGTTFDNFTFNTAKDAALSTNGYKRNADGTISANIKAVQAGTYGVYVTINGVQYKVFAVTVD